MLGSRQSTDLEGYVKAADRVWELFSNEEKEQFKHALSETRLAMGNGGQQIDLDITRKMWLGPKLLAQYLRGWMKLPLDERIKNIEADDRKYKEQWYSGPRIDLAAFCQSIQSGNPVRKTTFFDGAVKNVFAHGDDSCKCRTVPRDYEPSKFQIKAPIIYLNGDFDSATPMTGAQAHFDSQVSTSKKVFISIKDGGHFGTFQDINKCNDFIFQAAISANLEALREEKDFISNRCENKYSRQSEARSNQ